MKAVICSAYKALDQLKLQEVQKPSLKDNEILIRVHASTVQTADWRVQSLSMPGGMAFLARLIFGITHPRQPILGTEVSGLVAAVGEKVTLFKIGDPVIAALGAKFGGHAEFTKIAESGAVVLKPESLTFEEAAALSFGGMAALDFLKYKAQLKTKERVLIHGASGAVGLAAIQIAVSQGAHVTAVCSDSNFDRVRSLGASALIDYNKKKFWEDTELYDVIFDTIGVFTPSQGLRCLRKGGRLILISAGLGDMLGGAFQAFLQNKKLLAGVAQESKERLSELVSMVERNELRPVIDRTFPITAIQEAYSYVEKRHKQGNVVIEVSERD